MRRRFMMPVFGIALAAVTLTACSVTSSPTGGAANSSAASNTQFTPGSARRGNAVVRVVKQVLPAVVNVVAQTSQGRGEGTGFVVRSDGVIVTNYHVVEGAQRLTILSSDKQPKQYDARVIGGDQAADLAVLKIDAAGLATVPLGNSGALQLGQQVVAIGYALGLEGGPTVTTGIVSSLDRVVQAGDPNCPTTICRGGGRTYNAVIQTDAAINPGNSGGPLVDLAGRVVGINTAGAGSAENIGFAIQIDAAKQTILDATNNPGSPVAYLGVSSINANDPQIQLQFDLPVDRGAAVADVSPGGPAEAAGIQPGDVIVSFDGKAVTGSEQMGQLIRARAPGDSVEVGLVRPSGARETVTVTLGTNPVP